MLFFMVDSIERHHFMFNGPDLFSPFPFVDGLLYPSDKNAAGGVIGVTGYASVLGIKSG